MINLLTWKTYVLHSDFDNFMQKICKIKYLKRLTVFKLLFVKNRTVFDNGQNSLGISNDHMNP